MFRFFGATFKVIFTTVFTASLSAVAPAGHSEQLTIGDTFLIHSEILKEDRRINVYAPPPSGAGGEALPVLYMPDGGIGEDFLHVAGLIQVSAGNKTIRPYLLVGIENTERRRDLTGLTVVDTDRKIAIHVGGSNKFRAFLKSELMPEIRHRYKTTDETGIVGESLAGLFVVETFLEEPELFDTYMAFDPSLWWNGQYLLKNAQTLLGAHHYQNKRIFLAASGDSGLAEDLSRFNAMLGSTQTDAPCHYFVAMPQESHATIYHPAALIAFRTLLSNAGHDCRKP